jgi:phenylalanine-4-hydroxylase
MRRNRDFLKEFSMASIGYGGIEQTDYPGATDPVYRQRRQQIVDLAQNRWPRIPQYSYLPEEEQTWKLISTALKPLQDQHSCQAFLEGRTHLDLKIEYIPQLDHVSTLLESTTGMMLIPIGGLVDSQFFLSLLAHKSMCCTAYIRHHQHPNFTPEPDIIHELWGHAPMFMLPAFVEFSVYIGEACQLAIQNERQDIIDKLMKLYWFTVEYGLIYENGHVKIFGAGNNAGLQDLRRSITSDFPKKTLSDEIYQCTVDYDEPQAIFYVADSYEHIMHMATTLKEEARYPLS